MVLRVLLHGVATCVFVARILCNCTGNPGFNVCSVPDVEDVVHGLPEDRVRTNNATIERLAELEVILLRAFHLHHVDGVLVRIQVLVALVRPVGILVQGLTSACRPLC